MKTVKFSFIKISALIALLFRETANKPCSLGLDRDFVLPA